MFDWALVDQSIAQLGFYLTTTSQFALIFLTMFIRKNLGAYRYLIAMFSVVGIAFATVEFVTFPILHNHNAGYMFFTKTRPFNVSNEVLSVMLAMYTGLFSTTISLLAVQFTYRYIAVFKPDGLKYFNGWYFLIWVLYAGYFGFQWGMGLHIFNKMDEYSMNYMKQEMVEVYGSDISEVPCQVFLAYQNIPDSTESFVRWRNVMSSLNMISIMNIQYAVMIYCGYQLNYEMEKKISMLSVEMKKLHRQIFKTLVLQITMPSFILFTPCTLATCTPYLNLEFSFPSGIFLCAYTLYPAIDAFILMYVITDYRKAFMDMIKNKSVSRFSSTRVITI